MMPVSPTRQAKVLVVDDQEVVRQAIVDTLGLMDVALLAADNVGQALDLVRSDQPDLVLCDIVFPGQSGYEFLAEVRRDPELASTLVVLMTGVSSMQDRLRAVDLGADDLLTKPFDQAELLSRVKALLRLKAREDDVKRANEEMRRRILLMSTLFTVGNQLRESLNPKDVLGVIRETLSSIVGVASFTIYLRKTPLEPFTLVTNRGDAGTELPTTMSLSHYPELVWEVLMRGQPFLHDRASSEAPTVDALPLVAVVPLIVEKQLVGVINVHAFASDRGDPLDFETAALLSSQVTAALLAANMQFELQGYAEKLADTDKVLRHTTRNLDRQMSHISMLMLFSAQLHSIDDLEALLSTLRDMLVNLIGVANYRLVYTDSGKQQIVTGSADNVAPQSPPEGWERVVATVLEKGEPVRDPDVDIIIAIPLLISGQPKAVLLIERLLQQKTSLTEEDVELLSLLAHEAAIALSTVIIREQQAARLRDFYAMLAHDFRSPLSSQAMALELLSLNRDTFDEMRGEMLDICIGTNHHVIGLLDDFLTYSQMQANAMVMNLQRVDFRQLIREAAEDIALVAEYRKQNLDVHVPDAPVMAMVDPRLIARVLANLLSNASKYTNEEGSIVVTLKVADDTALVHVADNGPGIPVGEISQIFQSYHRVNDERVQKKGTGLGLVVVKEIVENHGGRVWVASEGIPGRGSTFSFALPLNDSQDSVRGGDIA